MAVYKERQRGKTGMVYSLLGCALIAACLLLLVKNHKAAGVIVVLASVGMMVLSVLVAVNYFHTGWSVSLEHYAFIPWIMFAIEVLLAIYICYIGFKHKHYIVSLLAIIGGALTVWHEFFAGHHAPTGATLVIDKLSIIMILIIGIIGSLICIYTVAYMRVYAHHNHDVADRRVFFMAVLMIFMFAMFGLVIANSLMYLFFFWEITTFCSYLLIGYTKKPDATANALKALWMNLFGGVALAVSIVVLAQVTGVTTMDALIKLDSSSGLVAVLVFLMALAGLIKAAQMPFSTWLLGAMVAPTPSSALVHSSTMVKAGVFLIIRLSPVLGDTTVGRVVTLVGAFTFLSTALLSISQRDAKKILAYSTISNLGLIVMCASIGTVASLWTAIMMIIFHAVAKSLLFLAVGSTDHLIGSRDIEDMDGLLRTSPMLSMFLIVGILGMFLAPFGMVIAKWAAMKAVIDTGNILLLLTLAFGSSITLFFWTKWLGKIIANPYQPSAKKNKVDALEKYPMIILAFLTVLTCMTFAFISQSTIVPFLTDMFGSTAVSPINDEDSNIMLFMLMSLFVLPLFVLQFIKRRVTQNTTVYMAGENVGDNKRFHGSMGQIQQVQLRNWYLEDLFGEPKLLKKSIWIAIAVLIVGVFMIAGGSLL